MTDMADNTNTKLIAAAFEGQKKSYCPYSQFRVGAAVVSEDGKVFSGANVENASYGGAICAERTSLVKAVSEGCTNLSGLAVVSDLDEPITPCGICRQFLREFFAPRTPILLVSQSHHANANRRDTDYAGEVVIKTNIEELLPRSFGPEQLG
ncbi:hypothetical protein E3P92_02139 [Wallemia ichthyophaga]|uniref:Cytidine deaminase n=1 Tax=Wallemia ichthyophaga (strain EXF-994 / CBS 113033) TaxID=1299270 RepID=R9AJ29_WALI9|nr:Cytidine deaminase [Wallemia ichthyophaga EXF-994]TIA81870.1 hypothetical protein E3P98_01739 [Wallemia ichthyophaga]EOR00061.1 Cytidine deaminase [Wallemia ichthyophaga EXF-994]TIA99992.1 hypothetical protein E3P95_01873 [Wallemia ichthyophaga]TIB01279.1 hypothetical protein E3P94_01905 [Wallemia ichthyophaga]TIB06175.1 hypothetical protein E3P96_00688 [Wallemia ichthyophaga]